MTVDEGRDAAPSARGRRPRNGSGAARRGLRLALGLAAAAAVPADAGACPPDDPRPYPIYTAAHLADAMETLGPNFDAALRALDAGDHPAAKERLARAREQLAATITFWRRRGREDGVGFVRAAVRAMDGLDASMSVEEVDAAAAAGFAAAARAACDACHDLYREPDPEGGFRLRAAALEP